MKHFLRFSGISSGPIRPKAANQTESQTESGDPKPVEFDAVNGMGPPAREWEHPARRNKARAAVIQIRGRIASAASALVRAIDFYAVGHPTSAREDDS